MESPERWLPLGKDDEADITIDIQNLFARLEDVEAFEKEHGLGQCTFSALNTKENPLETVAQLLENKEHWVDKKIYTGRLEITEAVNKCSGKKPVGWDQIRKCYYKEQGLKLTYPPKHKKQVPILLFSDLLEFFE